MFLSGASKRGENTRVALNAKTARIVKEKSRPAGSEARVRALTDYNLGRRSTARIVKEKSRQAGSEARVRALTDYNLGRRSGG